MFVTKAISALSFCTAVFAWVENLQPSISSIDLLYERAARKHERDALWNEDAFMAAHLVSEGYRVFPPKRPPH